MKILFLNQTFYPDVVSTAQHLADLAVALAARGHEVTVVASRRAYDDPGKCFPKQETWKGVRIVRVPSAGFGKRAKWRRVLDFASFGWCCAWRAFWLPRQDVVVALTSPPLISVLGAGLAWRWQSRFVCWVMDLNPDEAIAAGWLRAGSMTARFLERVSRLGLRRSHRVVVLDRFMYAQLRQKGVSKESMCIVPPWSHDDAVRFDVAGRRRFRQQHGLQGKFVVMYSGNHSPCHPLDSVLAAAQRLTAQDDILFCFIGGGTEFRKIRSLAAPGRSRREPGRACPLRRNIVCLPYQPLSELSASLSAADLHLTVLGNRFVGVVHPCKIYNILRIGAPVLYIGPTPSPVSEALASSGHVLSAAVSHGNVDQLVQQIQNLHKVLKTGPSARSLPASSPFSQQKLVGRLTELLEALGPGSGLREND